MQHAHDGLRNRGGIERSAGHQIFASGVGTIKSHAWIDIQAIFLDHSDHTHDGRPILGIADAFSEGALLRPETVGKFLVDDADGRSLRLACHDRSKKRPSMQRDFHHVKIAAAKPRADRLEAPRLAAACIPSTLTPPQPTDDVKGRDVTGAGGGDGRNHERPV